ncbi:DNA helicase-2/ATP-dependent DNA helicase PcrA [Ruminiclostridium sufflavum DSM 19573]|uniref:DNA 3'-5' helicase n=1 Tax=Ruminiclostridium sufflavum DSM 19573 TaxID=1121337 RepID=A0A318XKG3_9FIRM|nr:ATP-dependent helicase [Ruminiclostridium sufflavum]PYG87036.1 DNA helicase-2/ATP-dependent DNA helicase PcrA [Ruminiclostridium sufflavum DSM 19573]
MDFFEAIKNKYDINLDEQQKKAVTHRDGPALVLAGPGSGKTAVITARAAYLILTAGVKPENILTVTFNKAAQLEMERRFQRLYGAEINAGVHFSTLHSFCNNVVRDYENMKGQKLRRIEGKEDVSKKHLLRDIYFEINNSKINDDELEGLINEIGFVKNKMIRDFDKITLGTNRFAQVYRAYEEYKKNHFLIDFDDMLTYAYAILSRNPKILNYYKSRYKYIQVDEGQDLSKIQLEVLNLLAQDTKNLYMVADDDQSIYGFRGAEPQYILNIEKQFENCSVYMLEANYRSTKNIVELSSKFIRFNENRFNKNHSAANSKKYDPVILNAKDDNAQIRLVLEKIKEKLAQDNNSELAVLYRNNLSSILIADILDRNEIPFKIKQNRLFFFKHWFVQDITAFLLFALDQQDIEAFTRIYYRMNRYISKAMLESAVSEKSTGEQVIDCIIKNVDLKQFQLNALKDLKQEFVVLSNKNPWSALEYIKNNFKYLDSIKGYCQLTGLSFEYLNRLFAILQEIALNCETLSSFLVRLGELEKIFEGVAELKPQGKNPVTLSTFHSSKGLEYDCVFMIDLNNSEIPGEKVLEQASDSKDKSALEEERRLFYVGMTRARYELYLIYPEYINNERSIRSVFINEVAQLIKKDIIDSIGEGIIVTHTKFGRGVVAAVNENPADRQTVEINFFSGRRKTLDLQLCLDNKLLSFD